MLFALYKKHHRGGVAIVAEKLSQFTGSKIDQFGQNYWVHCQQLCQQLNKNHKTTTPYDLIKIPKRTH